LHRFRDIALTGGGVLPLFNALVHV